MINFCFFLLIENPDNMSYQDSSKIYSGCYLSRPQNHCPFSWEQSLALRTVICLRWASWGSPPGQSWLPLTQTVSTPTLCDKERANWIRYQIPSMGSLPKTHQDIFNFSWEGSKENTSKFGDHFSAIVLKYQKEKGEKKFKLLGRKTKNCSSVDQMKYYINWNLPENYSKIQRTICHNAGVSA